ncbi:hypothetical protein SAMN05443529_13734 [Desulfosporosinus hippei DSM 8344]|uniref:Uncharacterized protein n=2 Tax=Desulfosporosinus TaxID=79206 RepID=A0A1G8KES2_9FIRM|nr:hypothetical protein SAMN05443529_13734 [Desulfosporosinus hippei DSM 8344]
MKVISTTNKTFVSISSNDFWREGQWLRYWEDRVKEYDVAVQQDGLTKRTGDTDER